MCFHETISLQRRMHLENPVVKVVVMVFSVGGAIAVGWLMWSLLGDNTPDTDQSITDVRSNVQDAGLCSQLGGVWTSSSNTCA